MGIKANKHRGRNRYHGRGKKAGRGAGKRGGRGLAGINKHRVMTRIKYMPNTGVCTDLIAIHHLEMLTSQ